MAVQNTSIRFLSPGRVGSSRCPSPCSDAFQPDMLEEVELGDDRAVDALHGVLLFADRQRLRYGVGGEAVDRVAERLQAMRERGVGGREVGAVLDQDLEEVVVGVDGDLA